jgi:hypothetical protein
MAFTLLPIKQLTVKGNGAAELSAADETDKLVIYDESASENKYIQVGNLLSNAMQDFSDVYVMDSTNAASYSFSDSSAAGLLIEADQLADALRFMDHQSQGIKLQADTAEDIIRITALDASSSQKGVASFNATQFSVTAGAVASQPISFSDGTTAGDINLAGAVVIEGTAKEVESAHDGSGTFTLGLPADVLISGSMATPSIKNADESEVMALDADADGGNVIIRNGLQVEGDSIYSSTGEAIAFSGVDTIIKGNLQVDGTQTIVNSTTVQVDDKNIQLGDGSAADAAMDGAGLDVASSSGIIASWSYDQPNGYWESSDSVNVANGEAYYVDNANMLDVDGAAKVRAAVAGEGLAHSAGVLSLDFSEHTATSAIAETDVLALHDGSGQKKISYSDLLTGAAGAGLARNGTELDLDIRRADKAGSDLSTAVSITLSDASTVSLDEMDFGAAASDDASIFSQIFANGMLLRGAFVADISSVQASEDADISAVAAGTLDYVLDAASNKVYFKASDFANAADKLSMFIAK